MSQSLLDEARSFEDDIRGWRRHLHAHPELSGEERETASYIASVLRDLGFEPSENVNSTHGLWAELRVNDAAPFVALRADIDALPITEANEIDYASKNIGVMHACGHDAHAAMLLGAARLLATRKAELKTNVRLLFQPHEEHLPGGAPDMIAGGALEDVSEIFGIHITSNLPIGKIGTRVGAFMAGVNPLRIEITGKGGHAAMPNECIDPIVAAAHVIVALQTVVSRNIPITAPVVVSVTQVEGGTADNIIPDRVVLTGTVRTFDESVRATVCRRVTEIAQQVAAAHGASATVELQEGYPVLNNDAKVTERALAAARELGFDKDHLEMLAPQGGGEDFAYYCQKLPGSFVFLGAANEKKDCCYPHHHARFNVDEDALAVGAALHAQFALGKGKNPHS